MSNKVKINGASPEVNEYSLLEHWSLIVVITVCDGMGWFSRTDPFFTDLSGLTLQSGVGVGPGGRLVKDEYTVGGGGTAAAAAAAAVGSAMEVDGEMNQTIQHHPSAQPATSNNAQQAQQGFIPGLPPPNPSKYNVATRFHSFSLSKLLSGRNFDSIGFTKVQICAAICLWLMSGY